MTCIASGLKEEMSLGLNKSNALIVEQSFSIPTISLTVFVDVDPSSSVIKVRFASES